VTAGKLLRLMKRYRNWPEVALAQLRGEDSGRVVLKDGLVIESPPGSLLWITEEIFFEEVYCPRGFAILPEDVVVDIGANVGAFTLYASRRTKGPIYAYEPFPPNIAFLRRNLSQNGVGNVVTSSEAVYEKPGTIRLFLSDCAAGHLLFGHNVQGPLKEFLEVSATTLQALMDDRGLSSIDFLKLDCEGAEGAILASTPGGYLERVRRIALEFHDNVSSLNHAQLIELLAHSGYETRLRWDGRSPFGYVYATRR
jgi:FkbM family methyltransferase